MTDELAKPDDELEIRVARLEAMVFDIQQKVTTIERACIHQIETRRLLDRVGVVTGVPVGTTSEHMHDVDKGGSWEGGGA